MAGLLDVAEVKYGDGNWTSGYDSEALACGFSVYIADPCTPDPPVTVVTPPDAVTGGITVTSFAIVSELTRVNRCMDPSDRDTVVEAASNSNERAVGYQFWTGVLAAVDVPIAAGIATVEDLVAVLDAFYSTSALYKPIVHMGYGTAMALQELLTDDMTSLRTGETVVISEGYPTDALGVTGPVIVHLGTVEVTVNYDVAVNTTFFETTRLASIEFDPCAANHIAAAVSS